MGCGTDMAWCRFGRLLLARFQKVVYVGRCKKNIAKRGHLKTRHGTSPNFLVSSIHLFLLALVAARDINLKILQCYCSASRRKSSS